MDGALGDRRGSRGPARGRSRAGALRSRSSTGALRPPWRALRALAPAVVVAAIAGGCSNYTFRYGPYGHLDLSVLVTDLENVEEGILRECFWIPFLYRRCTSFHVTGGGPHGKRADAAFPAGHTLRRVHRIGPLRLLWSAEDKTRFDGAGEIYHKSETRTVGWRLVAFEGRDVETEHGRYFFRELTLLGLLQQAVDGYPRRIYPRGPAAALEGSLPPPGAADSPASASGAEEARLEGDP